MQNQKFYLFSKKLTFSYFRRCLFIKTLKIVSLILLLYVTFTLAVKGYRAGVMKARLYRKKIPFPQHQENYVNTLTWIVNIKSNNTMDRHYVKDLASDLNLKFIRNFRDLDDHFIFAFIADGMSNVTESTPNVIEKTEERLLADPRINWFSHQKIVSRQKRWMPFTDPYYRKQWHLTNTLYVGMDTNVTGVWQRNITGSGVTVSIVDDGVEWNNPDLQDNYNAEGSWDFNGDDDDPMPDWSKDSNHHGTRCAGEVAAVPNNVCAVGVAYGAKVSALRILDGPMTDSLEAEAFTKFFHINDIYSCSWGPDDDGKTVDGPHFLAAAAMKHGIDFGRHGYGSIYVVASGNGGIAGDNCNYDGYANSLYTVTIGAVDETGHMPFYGEECASMLAVTFSNGGSLTRDIVTTDWTARLERSRTGCTEHHSGTSAAAPIAAGLVALMLQVQPCLTWRDVQYLIILTALKVDIDVAHWQRNSAGLWHSHKHGFGLMNAWRLVNAARVWSQVPWLTSFSYSNTDTNLPIPKGSNKPLKVSYTVTEQETNGFDLFILETIQVTLTIDHPCRGKLEIHLKSPHGTTSVLGAARPNDKSPNGFDDWTFSTVRCWGELPVGTWTLIISDLDYEDRYRNGVLRSWQLKLFGTPMSQDQLKKRMRLIEKSLDGHMLNSSSDCFPPHVTALADDAMAIKTLKILALIGGFLLVLGVYETLESLLCYNKEKKEHSKIQTLIKRAHFLAGKALTSSTPDETHGLLREDIPMQTFQANNDNVTPPFQTTSNIHPGNIHPGNIHPGNIHPGGSTAGHGLENHERSTKTKPETVLKKLRDVIHFHKNVDKSGQNEIQSNPPPDAPKTNGAHKMGCSKSDSLVNGEKNYNETCVGDVNKRGILQRWATFPGGDRHSTEHGAQKGGYSLLPYDSNED